MNRRKIIFYVFFSLLVIIGAAGIYIYREYNRSHRDTAELKPNYTISATELLKEFEIDEKSSNNKYWDKVLKVDGIIKELIKDEKGFYSVILGDTASLSSVRCSIDSLHSNKAASLQKGNSVAIKGICTGFNADELLGSDVILVRSIITQKN